MKTHYDVLGVPETATHEQIVIAYRLRTKILHPDRLDRSKQPVEWDLANELLKELNASYAVLRDPNSRAQYDRAIGVSATAATPHRATTSQAAPRTQPPPSRQSVVPPLSPGYARYQNLSTALRNRLISRCKGKVTPQFRTRIGGVITSYIIIVLVACVAAAWLSSAASERRESDWTQQVIFMGVIGFVATAHSLFRIIRWHSSPLKRYLIVTPLYVIETRFDELWYWPLWRVRGLNGTHRYYNSIYYGTDTVFTFEDGQRTYRLRQEPHYKRLVEALRAFSEKALSAEQQYDRQYFLDEDDFRGVQRAAQVKRYRWKLAIGTTCVAAVAILVLVTTILVINSTAPKPKPVHLGTTSNPGSSRASRVGGVTPGFVPDEPSDSAAPSPVLEPEQSEPPYDPSIEPANGAIFKNALLPRGHGTLTISNGTSSGAIVKLISTRSNRSVFTVFVGPNNSYTIRNIPNNTYRLAYASGRRFNRLTDSFERLYGISVFDQSLTYNTEDRYEDGGISTYYHTFEVTLQPVAGGNARTSSLPAQSFEQF